ncbi:MAG: flagellin, partial [Eubacteriales bacterium]
MRISNNVAAMNTYRQYSSNAITTNKSMEKLSSGSRINRAADDAAGLSISEKMRSQIRGLTQANRNAQDGVSFIQTAEGALNEVSDMLTRLKELAVQVQNGTYSDADKINIGAEMKALGTAVAEIYANTKFNGISVFGEQENSAGVLTSKDGTGNAATIAYGENATQSITIKQSKTEKLNALTVKTAAATTAENAANVTVDLVEEAITEVNTQRASYGAQQNQLEHASNNMATTKENLQAAESRVRDVDMAEEIMEYTKDNILLQAAQAM